VGVTEKQGILEWRINRRDNVFAVVKVIMKGSLGEKSYTKMEQENNQS